MFKPEKTILICPQNDLERQSILEIAKNLGIEVRASTQIWGAGLEKEPDKNFHNPDKKNFWIVEIPGPEKEAALKNEGYALTIIDHHESLKSCSNIFRHPIVVFFSHTVFDVEGS